MFKQYKEAIESSNIVSKTDIHGIITFANDEFCKISGYSRDELIGQDHNIVRHPDISTDNFRRLWQTILTKNTYRATVKNLAKDGSCFYVNTTIIPILDDDGEIEEFMAIRYDVTQEEELKLALQQKEAELKLLNKTLEDRVSKQTQNIHNLNKHLEHRVQEEIEKNEQRQKMLFSQSRFASLGQMIANIAHQWRQPLTELNLSLFSLKSSITAKNTDEMTQHYKDAKNTIKSMSQTIEDFQNFFNPNKSVELFDPTDSVKDSLALLKKVLLKESISVECRLDESIRIIGVSTELTQVLVNILQNAKDALIGSDTIDRAITIDISSQDSEAVITIEDNANGIDEDIVEQIFEPYFSTKHASKGTGLGLFMSRMIVQQSLGGTILASSSDYGAKFTIKIPLGEINDM